MKVLKGNFRNMGLLLLLITAFICPISGESYPHKIDIYGSPTCHLCHDAEEFFKQENMSYTFHDIGEENNTEKLMEYYYRANITEGFTIPTIIVDDRWIIRGGITIGDVRDIKSTKNLDDWRGVKIIGGSALPQFNESNDSKNISNKNNTSNNIAANNSNTSSNDHNKSIDLVYLFMLTGIGEIINPCSWAVYLYFISFVIAESKDRRDILKYGASFILSAYIIYGIMAFGIVHITSQVPTGILYNLLAIIAIATGLVKIYEGAYNKKILAVSKKAVKNTKINVSLMGAMLGGAAYATILSPCVIPGYVVASSLMSKVDFPWFWVMLYNLIILLPALFITFVAYMGMGLKEIKDIREKNKNTFKIIIGTLLIIVGILLKIYYG